MKSFVIPALVMSAVALGACQTSSAGTAAAPQTIDLPGTQAHATVVVPSSSDRVASDQPFALQGTQVTAPAMPTGNGYQAR